MPPVTREDIRRYRISQEQGTGEEVQTTEDSSNTGIPAIAGNITGEILARRAKPLKRELGSASLGALFDVGETAVRQAIDPDREVNVGGMAQSASTEFGLSILGGGAVRGTGKAVDLGKFVVAKGGEAVRRKIASKIHAVPISNEAKVADSVLRDKANKYNIPTLTPAEATSNAWIDLFDNIAKNSLIGGDLYAKFLTKRNQAFDELAEELIAPYGKVSRDPGSIGDMIVAVIKDNKTLADLPAKVIRNTVEHQAAELGLRAEVGEIRRHALRNLREIQKGGGLGGKRRGKQVSKSITEATSKGVDDINDVVIFPDELKDLEDISNSLRNLPTDMPVSDLIKLRSDLLDVQRGLSENKKLNTAPVMKFVGEQVQLMNTAIKDGLRQPGASSEMLPMWERSNTVFRKNAEQFSDKVVTKLIKSLRENPAGVSNAILKASSDNSFRIVKKAKEALLPESLHRNPLLPVGVSTTPWRKLQRFTMEGILEGARHPGTGVFRGQQLLERLQGVGMAALSELYGAKHASQLIDFAKTLELTQRKNPISTGAMGTQMVQVGAVLSFTRDITAQALTVLLGPAQIARIMTQPKGVTLLKQSLSIPKSDPRMTAIAGRLLAMASNDLEAKELQRPQPSVSTQTLTNPLVSELLGPSYLQ